jgi:hypothetical protein
MALAFSLSILRWPNNKKAGENLDYRPDRLSDDHWHLLKSISDKQRDKFHEAEIIPCQVLCLWWEMGYLPHKLRPAHNTKMRRLLDHLNNWIYRDEAHAQKGMWLFDRIVIEERMPRCPPRPEKFLKIPRGKWFPRFELRRMPGTIS